MVDGYTAMQGMIDKLRELGQSTETIAADIAPELRDELEGNITASRAPDGTAWKPTLAGTPPLKNAAASLGVAAVGTKVIAALRGIESRHHYGTVSGKIARPILPGTDLPSQIVDLVTRIANKRFRMIMGGE
ncbi:MAG: hypothetical protein GY700_13530 [Propionibacteriaceae bacterium]|nr:hypothetical protein [Propionibacteriaceae bacterium]